MPRGKYVNHKGRSRHFTSPDELERERKKELEKKWRKKKEGDEEDESSEEEEEEVAEGAAGPSAKKSDDESGSEESESESEDDESKKKKGVEGLIEIENPNRIVKKVKKPAAKVDDGPVGPPVEGNPNIRASSSSVKPELSRREREELEKQRARAHYQKLHAEGKTEEARADLARLALIRKQREEAAKKREDEKKAKDAASAAKQEQTNKALGKKS